MIIHATNTVSGIETKTGFTANTRIDASISFREAKSDNL